MTADLFLPLPLPLWAAKILLVCAFLLHIVFVNLMVGGTLVTLYCHWRGRFEPLFLDFAKQLLDTVTVHKSIAVVLGIGPLLLISVAYTVPFYTSSTLIAPYWLSVIWLVTVAFGLLYGYKFGWEHFRLRYPLLHGAMGAFAAACFLVIPLIYLTNTNLMLTPAAWSGRPSFFDALLHIGNVLPRYVHFLLASVAITGFWIALWWRRATISFSEEGRRQVIRLGTVIALAATVPQFLAGPLVLFTLPRGAITPIMLGVLALGIIFGVLSVFSMVDSLRGDDRMVRAAAFLVVTICCMGATRHLVREALLDQAEKPFIEGAVGLKIVFAGSGEGGGFHEHQPTADQKKAKSPTHNFFR